ncbi:carbohydrate ABC transporter membrane protein 2, CUT1 family (TC 3.A.1.1.-) [Caldanaerobius fijiensis DSM 17918]|uniref:Carbohydrate ABC transporter membrane protein 2, CUT1 family (TC 3.A.1.1.-) n=1 Tax=Caldanaerobius fijiensis DSM 17918 TaxID=1121256 RepID=A0A1M4XA76_9THEO|nr:carbohydrate ABC transporter permease [Caldanaerobius fijiensis]SHE90394.1 carbohydrate ABC transporter membrane protein 2, CUT1 family (TC 3.A.1.1.-) [Caldanaerobius fijiensis DSM 17918]
MKVKKALGQIIFAAFVALFLAFIIFPFFWQVITSIKPPAELWAIPPKWIPSKLYTGYYISVFVKRPFGTYLKNSIIVASATTLFSVFVSSFAAYALARLKFKGKTIILSLVLAVSMFPGIAIITPLFLFLKNIGLLNTYMGLILPYTTFTVPLSLWILTTFFKEIPFDLEESAKVDGATPLQAFIKIIFPLATPGMFTTAILTFIAAWNEFIFALVFNTQDAMRTVPVGIAMFPGEHDLPWGDMAAASVIVTVPLIILVLIFQRRIISGLTAGAVKG